MSSDNFPPCFYISHVCANLLQVSGILGLCQLLNSWQRTMPCLCMHGMLRYTSTPLQKEGSTWCPFLPFLPRRESRKCWSAALKKSNTSLTKREKCLQFCRRQGKKIGNKRYFLGQRSALTKLPCYKEQGICIN